MKNKHKKTGANLATFLLKLEEKNFSLTPNSLTLSTPTITAYSTETSPTLENKSSTTHFSSPFKNIFCMLHASSSTVCRNR